jgi:hypothetical protein
MKGYVDSQSFYSNVKVETYLPTYDGNIAANISKAGYTWTFGTDAVLTLPSGATILESGYGSAGAIRLKPNGGTSTQYLEIAPTTVDGNHVHLMAGSGTELFLGDDNHYVKLANTGNIVINSNDAAGNAGQWTFGTDGRLTVPGNTVTSTLYTENSGYRLILEGNNSGVTTAKLELDNDNGHIRLKVGNVSTPAIWAFRDNGNLTLPSGGYILNSDNSIYGGGNYSNVEVATYLQSGNIANISVAGNVTATYFVGNGALLTGIVGGASNYGNVDVRNFLKTGDGASRLIQGYYANIDLGATARLFSFGATAKSYFGHDGQLGNASINWVRADNGDVRISTNNAAYNWIFDRDGNLTLSGNTFSVNYANGTPVTFSSSSYSNVQVAAYLNTQGYNLYSNVNVASYLTTATITTTGNVTAANFVGNISITGNVTGTSSNVTLQAGAYTSVFDNQGNVTVPQLFTAGNIQTAGYFVGNGTLLTGVAIKTTGSWTVPTGNSTQSFTVPLSGTYQLWVDCNIPNGILAYNATATVTNSNVPVVGEQYAWVYNGGGTPIDFTSIPNQFVGTGNTIVRSSVSPSATTNRFDFGLNNTSGGNVTVSYGYVKIS